MQHAKTLRRLLSVLLVLTLLGSLLVPAVSAENALNAEKASTTARNELSTTAVSQEAMEEIEEAPYALTDIVRVSIELEDPAVSDMGYSLDNFAENTEAVSYREGLKAKQAEIQSRIEAAIGSKLEVKWNLTLLMNVISANVRYGDIETIRKLAGVRDVFLETQYEAPEDAEEGEHPNTANTSTYMVGAAEAWAEGYTGAGSRVAIIDTGLDTSHQSVNADAFNYAIQQTGKTISLFTQSDLNSIKSQLNGSGATYVSAKIPFGYNYVDNNTTITHLNDTQGEHGSHVAGIAAANRFLKSGSSYVDAASSVGVVGMAPDAQLFIMKVFGSGGGAYDSDYMVAIEDAIVLDCDAVNLSLGSAAPGFTYSSTSSYQNIMTKLANAGVNSKLVVSISAGNAGALTENLTTDLYIQDIAMHTGGNPGTFINSLCVASANNTGVTGMPMYFNGTQKVFYSETSNSGGNLSDVAGSYNYVYIDAVGNSADYSAVNSAVSLSGKVVIVNRGEISFVDKGNNLKSYSPKALIVANNADGLINMALDDYTGTFPMVSISLADAQTIKANSTAHTTGSYTYYTGSVTVTATLESGQTTDNAEMSYFSSWGAPGSLLMKPEITAPGGNIYSIFGTNKTSSGTAGGSDQYELMSGTSMAAPHVTGLTGTLAQYLRENNITISGKTTRQIAQSLLMSTAVPMHEGSASGPYYPILQQGAGLVNVRQAIHASSFIFMNSDATISYADGKVKAELGDKPSKSGNYTYTFNIYNTASKAQTYNLSTDLFTQDRYVGDDGYAHMSSSTTALNWPVSYSTGNTVTVPAGGSQSVTVTISIPADMSEFDALYPCGAYVEGYTFIESQTNSKDGAKLDVKHSIPILGFYGSWTDPSMFDNMSYVDVNVYNESRVAYTGTTNTNYMTYTRGGSTKYVTGNPYFTESPFPGDRLALRSTDTIYQIKYSLVRSAGTTGIAASKIDDEGNVTSVLSASVSSTNVTGLYYSSSSGAWQNTSAKTVSVSKTLSSYGAADGERVRVGFYAIPEYNAMKVNTDVNSYSAGYLSSTTFQTVLRSNVLGKGAMIGYDFYVDDTAPAILSAIRSGSTVTVTVQDNAYIARLALLNGSTVIEELVPEQTAKGQTVTYSFDISGVSNTSNLQVFVGDYASNETTQAPEELLYTITASSNNSAWGTVSVVGNTILAEPAEGYYVESVQVTSGTANPVVSGNNITVNPSSDCAILVNFAAKPQYTVSYQANGVSEGSETAYVNDVITLPDSISNTDIAEGYSFIGWYTAILPETTDKPVYYEPGASYTVTANATLLALFKRVEGNDGDIYRMITELPADLSGNYVISSGTTASDYIMINTTGVYYRNTDACTTISGGGITVADDTLLGVLPSQVFVITPASSSGYYRIMMNSIDGTYVADSSSGLCSTTNAEGSLNIWSIAAGTNNRFLLATEQYDNYKIGLNTSYNAFDTIRNGTGVYLWKGEPAGISYYTTNPLTESHDHELQFHAAVSPTCTEAGSTAYYQCTLCGKCFTDAAGENEIAPIDTVIAALGHNYVGVVTAPTVTEQGYTTYTCSRCGDSYVDDYTDPLGYDYTVHFTVPVGVTAPADMISNTNTGITLPTVEGPEGYSFLGWVTEDYNNVETCPANILTGNYIAPQDITLKALFSWVDGEGSGELSYELVSAAPADWTGKYVITYGIDTSLYVMKGVTVSSNGTSIENSSNTATYANSGVSLNGTTLTNVGDAYLFAMAQSSGSYYTIRSVSTGTYLGMNTNSYLAGYSTYAETNCDWTPGAKANASSAFNAMNGTYPALSFSPSNGYFWSGSANTSALTNVRFWRETQNGTLIYTTIIGEEHVHTPGSPVTENVVEATCTAAGSYDTVVYCTECGAELSRDHVDVDALGHDWSEWSETTAPSCTVDGEETRSCSRCSETETRPVTALGHLPGEAVRENYVEPTATDEGGYDMVVYCQRCNAELSREHTVLPATGPVDPIERTSLRLFRNVSIGTDMLISFSILESNLTEYDSWYIQITKDGPEGAETYLYEPEACNLANDTYSVDFTHITAKEMGVMYHAQVFAMKDGVAYCGPVREGTMKQYLASTLTSTDSSVSATLKTLAADMLNYGAAAQVFLNYDTEHLVNVELSETELTALHNYETTGEASATKTITNTVPTGEPRLLYTSVAMTNRVELGLFVNLNNLSGWQDAESIEVQMKDHETQQVVAVLPTVLNANGTQMDASFPGIGAKNMRTEYDFVTLVDGVERGNIRTWSIEGYVNQLRNDNSSSDALKALANAVLIYGDSAQRYLDTQT